MTRFVEVAPDPAGADPACAAVARILRRLLEGAEEPADLEAAIDDALDGSIATVEGLRARLSDAARGPITPLVPVPQPPARRVWLLVLVSLAILAVLVFLIVGLPLLLTS